MCGATSSASARRAAASSASPSTPVHLGHEHPGPWLVDSEDRRHAAFAERAHDPGDGGFRGEPVARRLEHDRVLARGACDRCAKHRGQAPHLENRARRGALASQCRELSVDPVLGLVQPTAPQPVGAVRRPGRGPDRPRPASRPDRPGPRRRRSAHGSVQEAASRLRRDRSSTWSVGSGRGTSTTGSPSYRRGGPISRARGACTSVWSSRTDGQPSLSSMTGRRRTPSASGASTASSATRATTSRCAGFARDSGDITPWSQRLRRRRLGKHTDRPRPRRPSEDLMTSMSRLHARPRCRRHRTIHQAVRAPTRPTGWRRTLSPPPASTTSRWTEPSSTRWPPRCPRCSTTGR